MITTAAAAAFWRDNPITWHPDPEYVAEWLADNQYTATAGFRPVLVSATRLRELPGRRGEHLLDWERNESAAVDWLASDMQQNGWREGSCPLIGIEQDGLPYIFEGNHRIRAAASIGLDEIPVEVRYFGGAESIPGVWTPTGERLPL